VPAHNNVCENEHSSIRFQLTITEMSAATGRMTERCEDCQANHTQKQMIN